MEAFLSTLVSYFISLTVNENTDVIHRRREAKLEKILKNEKLMSRALNSVRTLREEFRTACIRLAQDKDKLKIRPAEEPIWNLLITTDFQDELCDWMMSNALPEGDSIKENILFKIENAFKNQQISPEKLIYLREQFFNHLEKTIFANDILARWRHQQSLDFLRNQVSVLRQRADEAAGMFDALKQKAALDHYCDEAFKSWDIIDLTNLPEGDVDLATQNLLVRQLYMPLRISIEHSQEADVELSRIEEKRELRRRREAGYQFGEEENVGEVKNSGIGVWLQTNNRMVVLGDPGGGKTTMLRWLATAMLLRYRQDPAFSQLPDVETLPEQHWIPVLIRCRDLGEADLCRCFSDFLSQHFLKTTLLPEEARVMQALILEKIANNQVLLMVDGLDEITNPKVRVSFCQELERTAARYPNAPIVVTSRIVGYRDMPFRMGKYFQHGVICELDRVHKDLFAKRWIEVTEQRQSADERIKREKELIEALHASDRIERLTGNPMLLTTLALVKRKVGKLPSRRNKLYAEAVAVLLNWNPGYYAPIDDSEAIPQLEYLAYEMCRRGVQRLTDNEIMDLLEQFRKEYPTVRSAKNHSEREFLALLEARSSILIKAGSIWGKGQQKEQAAWEFRHLTFQEYLAAQALIDGKYPNRDRNLTLAMQVAPLAGIVKYVQPKRIGNNNHLEVTESWREALRLLAADCKDDDVDSVLYAILNPLPIEDHTITRRTRAILAALCLADEPNASEEVADKILEQFVQSVQDEDGYLHMQSPLSIAALELGRSQWRNSFRSILIRHFIEKKENESGVFGSLWGFIGTYNFDDSNRSNHLQEIIRSIRSQNRIERISAALMVMHSAYSGKIENVNNLVDELFDLMLLGDGECHAAVWALGWFSKGSPLIKSKPYWTISETQADILCKRLAATAVDSVDTQYWIINILSNSKNILVGESILPFILAHDERPRIAAIEALATIGDHRFIGRIADLLKGKDEKTLVAAAVSLSSLGDKRGRDFLVKEWHNSKTLSFDLQRAILTTELDPLNKKLLSNDFDGAFPLVAMNRPIDAERLAACAKILELPVADIQLRYESIAAEYRLKLSWKD